MPTGTIEKLIEQLMDGLRAKGHRVSPVYFSNDDGTLTMQIDGEEARVVLPDDKRDE